MTLPTNFEYTVYMKEVYRVVSEEHEFLWSVMKSGTNPW